MTKSELINELQKYRDNDIRIEVPCSSGGDLTLKLDYVFYADFIDCIIIRTEEHLDDEDEV